MMLIRARDTRAGLRALRAGKDQPVSDAEQRAQGAPGRAARPARGAPHVTTGGADAMCFLHLGQAFASVITGNLVLLGLSAAKGTAAIAANSAIALGGYGAGVLAGAPIARETGRQESPEGLWPARVTICLAAELAV